MTLRPNRISAFGSLTPAREQQLAQQLLEVQSEEELDHFLPLLAAAVPMLAKVAGPLLKNLAGGLFGGGGGGGGGGGRKRRRPRDEQEQFLGKIVKGLFGEVQAEDHEEEQFLGGIIKGLLGGGREMEAEQQQFLGSLVGKLLGREAETENYVQEQFLGGIIKGLLGGGREMEAETAAESETEEEGDGDYQRLMWRARKFVRLVNAAATHAAGILSNIQRTGRRPGPAELRQIVLSAIVNAARRYSPRLASAAFPTPGSYQGQPGAAPGAGQAPTLLETMIAEASPMGVSGAAGRHKGTNGYPLG